MKPNAIVMTLASLACGVLAACADEDGSALKGGGPGGPPGVADPTTPPTDPTTPPPDPALCAARAYTGYDAKPLTAGRVAANIGVDRQRIKPFSALQTELPRVLGAAPASLTGAGPTFGQAPARWYEEPRANAVALQTTYAIAFDGCLTYTATAPEFAAAPDATTAAAQCGAMARKFWSKTPAPLEIQACADVALKGAASEPLARRKWAYACASVLTASGFLTY